MTTRSRPTGRKSAKGKKPAAGKKPAQTKRRAPAKKDAGKSVAAETKTKSRRGSTASDVARPNLAVWPD